MIRINNKLIHPHAIAWAELDLPDKSSGGEYPPRLELVVGGCHKEIEGEEAMRVWNALQAFVSHEFQAIGVGVK